MRFWFDGQAHSDVRSIDTYYVHCAIGMRCDQVSTLASQQKSARWWYGDKNESKLCNQKCCCWANNKYDPAVCLFVLYIWECKSRFGMLDIACSLQLCSTMKWSVFFSEAIVIYKSMISLLDTQLNLHVFFYFGPFFTQQIHVEYVRRKCQNRHMTPQIRIWLDHAVQFNTQHMHWRTHTHTWHSSQKSTTLNITWLQKKKCIMNVHPNLIEVKWTCQMCNIIVSYACNFHEKCYIDLIATDTTTRGAYVSARAAERYQIENG